MDKMIRPPFFYVFFFWLAAFESLVYSAGDLTREENTNLASELFSFGFRLYLRFYNSILNYV
jgi:hypothetical protein